MQVEIKSVTQNDSEYQGKVTKRLAIETSEGNYNVSEKNKSYSYIPVGYNGMADITFGNYKGKKYIEHFKPLNTKPTQTAQKPQQQANKPVNGAYKKDPAGILLETWKRKHTSWIGCLQCAVKRLVGQEAVDNEEIIILTNKFYDALCQKVDKKKDGTCEPQKSDSNNNNINNDIHRKTGPIETKANERPEVLENENENIEDVPF